MLKLFLSFCEQDLRMTEVRAFDSPLQTIAPFPNIFSEYVNQHGFVDTFCRPSSSGDYFDVKNKLLIRYS